MSIPQLITRRYLCALLPIFFFFTACRKSNKPGQGPESHDRGAIVTLKGTVVDESGKPIGGAIVKADGQQATTTEIGSFQLQNVKTNAENAVMVNCSKTGYRTQIRRVSTAGGNNASMFVAMPYKDVTMTFQSVDGAKSQLPDGVMVEIPANAVVRADGSAYTGAVQLAVQHLSTDDPDFSLKIPGGDLRGERTDKIPVMLYSFGMVDVEMTTAAGEKLQLKSGKTSTIKFPITATQINMATPEIPLWHFDEASGIWKEEGRAIKQGTVYVGNVGHFSTWNVDVPLRTALVKGKLTDDCKPSNPSLRGVVIKIGQMSVSTDNEGNYSLRVPAGIPLIISVDPRQNMGRTVTKEISPLAEGATSVQDISLPCGAAVAGRVIHCNPATFSSFVTMEVNGVVYAQTYTDVEDKYQLHGPMGANVMIKVFNPSGGSVAVPAMVPDYVAINYIPDIRLCQPDVNLEATFMLRGPGLEQQYRIDGGTAVGVTDAGGGKTTCVIQESEWRISLTIPGITEGNYQSGSIILDLNDKRYIADKAQIKVSRFGAVGELIEGTFSGIASPVGGGNKMEFVGGRFTVRRIAG